MPKHTFVLCGSDTAKGWWLKITSLDELAEYNDKHSGRWGRALENIRVNDGLSLTSIAHGKHTKEIPLSESLYLYAMNRGISVVSAVIELTGQITQTQVIALLDNREIYINAAGGWCYQPYGKKFQVLHKDDFTFPNFTKDDIVVSKWPGGAHYYARIGNMEVHDGDTVKWNSYQEAYDHALTCLV